MNLKLCDSEFTDFCYAHSTLKTNLQHSGAVQDFGFQPCATTFCFMVAWLCHNFLCVAVHVQGSHGGVFLRQRCHIPQLQGETKSQTFPVSLGGPWQSAGCERRGTWLQFHMNPFMDSDSLLLSFFRAERGSVSFVLKALVDSEVGKNKSWWLWAGGRRGGNSFNNKEPFTEDEEDVFLGSSTMSAYFLWVLDLHPSDILICLLNVYVIFSTQNSLNVQQRDDETLRNCFYLFNNHEIVGGNHLCWFWCLLCGLWIYSLAVSSSPSAASSAVSGDISSSQHLLQNEKPRQQDVKCLF